MTQLGKAILIVGVALVVLGGVLWAIGRLLHGEGGGWRGLPGDIFYQSDRITIFFPIVTCLVLSAILTLALWLWHWLGR